MRANVTQLEAATIARALAKEEAEMPMGVRTPEGIFFPEIFRDETSVRLACGCRAEVVSVFRNVVVVACVRCKHHGDKAFESTYAVELGGGFAALNESAEPYFRPHLHAPLAREDEDAVH